MILTVSSWYFYKDEAKLLANHNALFSIIINVVMLMVCIMISVVDITLLSIGGWIVIAVDGQWFVKPDHGIDATCVWEVWLHWE